MTPRYVWSISPRGTWAEGKGPGVEMLVHRASGGWSLFAGSQVIARGWGGRAACERKARELRRVARAVS